MLTKKYIFADVKINRQIEKMEKNTLSNNPIMKKILKKIVVVLIPVLVDVFVELLQDFKKKAENPI